MNLITDQLIDRDSFCGTLLDIGIGKRPVECINAILEGKEKPSASCDTKGLILYNIVY